MSKSKIIVFAVAAMTLSTLFTTAVIIGVDVYLHKRYERLAGLNVWGYRGPAVGHKRPGEQRIVVLGGSTAFGYGVTAEKSFPPYLERKLNEARHQGGQGLVSVVNLAYNNEGAYSFSYTLRDYEYLGYDVALLYTGYNDLGGLNTTVFRHESPVFRLTGYLPIFPLILREKAMVLRYGGNLEDAYWGKKTVFKPNLAERATATALEAAVGISRSLERQLGRLSEMSKPLTQENDTMGCAERWAHYCNAIHAAVEYAVSRGKQVVVVTQPYISDEHVEQQRVMVAMLKMRFGAHPGLHYVNLGRAVDLKDRTLAYDGVHLTAPGNERIAESLVQPILKILE